MVILTGLIHKGACGGMVAPLFVQDIDEVELREMVGNDAVCMRCHEGVTSDEMEAEYLKEDGGTR